MKKLLLSNLLFLFILSSCSEDDTDNLIDFSVSFDTESTSLQETDSEKK